MMQQQDPYLNNVFIIMVNMYKYCKKAFFFLKYDLCSQQHFNNCRLLSTTPKISNEYDIIIVGGGMVGGAMACAIGQSAYLANKSILLIDGSPIRNLKTHHNAQSSYSARVCAISPGNVKFLKKIKSWQHIPRYSNVKRMQVWDGSSSGMITFEKDNMSENLCTIVENDMVVSSFIKVLNNELKGRVDVLPDSKVGSCVVQHSKVVDSKKPVPKATLTLTDGTELTTKLLIAADGANSFIAQTLGLDSISWNYDQSAVIANLTHEPTENIVAWQRFLPTGPIALLPLNDTTSSLVWSTSHKHAQALLNMSEDEFVFEINNAFWKEMCTNETQKGIEKLLGDVLNSFVSQASTNLSMQYPPSIAAIAGKRFKFPLGCSHANEYVKPRVAFIGDTIHRVHPLAGQGVNLGFRDVECLVETLSEAAYKGHDIGSLTHLLEYEAQQQLQNLPFVSIVNGLKYLFSTNNPSAVLLRSVGLTACNFNTSLKEMFIEQATK